MQIYAVGVDGDFGFELPVVRFSGKLKEVSPIGASLF